MTRLRIAITGALGYVGTEIANAAVLAGHEVIALGRGAHPLYPSRSYDLSLPVEPGLLNGADVVIHCAYDLSLTRESEIRRVNIDGTRQLLALSSKVGARFCLVSSMSAYEGTTQLYGRAKLAAERAVLASKGNVARLGLVYGGSERGMIASLRQIAKAPVIPIVGRASHQFMVHAADMAQAILRLAESGQLAQQLAGLANPEPIRFDQVICRLAPPGQRAPVLIPVPWQPVYAAMRVAEATGVKLPIRADSVLGLVRPALVVPNVGLWRDLGVTLRSFDL